MIRREETVLQDWDLTQIITSKEITSPVRNLIIKKYPKGSNAFLMDMLREKIWARFIMLLLTLF